MRSFSQSYSPLKYPRSSKVYRLAVVDSEADPPSASDTYFAPTTHRVLGRSGKSRTEEAPGAAPGVIAFLDWHNEGDGVYIDFMKTRKDFSRQGIATQLVEALYLLHHDKSYVNWGDVTSNYAWKMLQDRRATEGPNTRPYSIGKLR